MHTGHKQNDTQIHILNGQAACVWKSSLGSVIVQS